jgi:hypothetical protein
MPLVTIRGQLESGAPEVGRFEDHICLFPSLFAGVKFGKIVTLFGGPKHPQHLGALLTSFLEA